MLLELRVANFALIQNLQLEFGPGLVVLSGETGAGKSIVIGAISLLLGERAVVEHVRQGEEAALIEGIFLCDPERLPGVADLLAEAGLPVDEELIVGREVLRSGRSIGRVNGRTVPIAFLKELGKHLIDLHGQHQHQSLLRAEEHLELLDHFGGRELLHCRQRVADLFHKRRSRQRQLAELGMDQAERERRMDILSYQIKEIEEAGLQSGEEEALQQQERIMANAEKLYQIVGRAYQELAGTGMETTGAPLADRLSRVCSELVEAAGIDGSLASAVELLNGALAQLEEAILEIRDYRERVVFNPAELSAVQDRLDRIRALKRKYGATIEEVLAFAASAAAELERLQNSEEQAARLEAQIAALEEELLAACRELADRRRQAAGDLEKRLQESLQALALPGAQFKVLITDQESPGEKGMNRVEFMFSANPGEAVKPLARIISGGEMSRVMLAMKSILARADRIPTLIFDEVDAGIGGATVQAVAEKLAALAAYHQVICVTHSPQIAAMAGKHIRLYKETAGERTLTRAETLQDEQRRQEIARMLDGAEIGTVSLQHVDNLLQRAAKYKNRLDN